MRLVIVPGRLARKITPLLNKPFQPSQTSRKQAIPARFRALFSHTGWINLLRPQIMVSVLSSKPIPLRITDKHSGRHDFNMLWNLVGQREQVIWRHCPVKPNGHPVPLIAATRRNQDIRKPVLHKQHENASFSTPSTLDSPRMAPPTKRLNHDRHALPS